MDGIDIFPVADKVIEISRKLQGVSILLVEFFLIVFIALAAIQRMDDTGWSNKLWNIAVTLVVIASWPTIVLALKEVVDAFNYFLVRDVFEMEWRAAFVEPSFMQLIDAWARLDIQTGSILMQILNFIAIIFLVVARFIIYGLYWVFLFFLIALGPLILAKGVLMDEIEALKELLKETLILLLWQTTYVVIFGLLEANYFSEYRIVGQGENPFVEFGKVIALAVLTLFVPTITRKYANHLGTPFFPVGLRWGGAFLGLTLLGRGMGIGRRALGFAGGHGVFAAFRHRALHLEEVFERGRHQRHTIHLEQQIRRLKHELAHKSKEGGGPEDKLTLSVRGIEHHPLEAKKLEPKKLESKIPSRPPHPRMKTPKQLVSKKTTPKPSPASFQISQTPLPKIIEKTPLKSRIEAKDLKKKEAKRKETEETSHIKQRVRLLRGRQDSDKFQDIHNLGIPIEWENENPDLYLLFLEYFNIYYGQYYSLDGKWIAEDQTPPKYSDFKQKLPEKLAQLLPNPEDQK